MQNVLLAIHQIQVKFSHFRLHFSLYRCVFFDLWLPVHYESFVQYFIAGNMIKRLQPIIRVG